MSGRYRPIGLAEGVWVSLGVALAAACNGQAPTSGDLFSVRDSAGVHIASNRWPGEEGIEWWSLDSSPELSIGDPASSPEAELFQVGLPMSFPDGRVIFAQDGRRVTVFGPDGEFVRSIGRVGEGPGEFKAVAWTFPVGDSAALVFGISRERLMMFNAESGELLAEGRRGDEGARASYQFPLSDGRLAGAFESTNDTLRLGWIPPTGGAPTFLGAVPREGTWDPDAPRPPTFLRSQSLNYAAGERIWAGWGGRYEVRVFDPDQGLIQIVRAEFPVRPVSQRMRDSIFEAREAAMASIRPVPGVESPRLSTLAVPDSFPAYDLILGTRTGSFWVRRPPKSEEAEGARWDIFDAEGRYQASIRIPDAFRLSEVSETHVLGVWTGEYDVQSVRRYRIVKEGL